ncbi:MAG: YvcK family protein [Candidatus Nomurabacteria bacterium]|jgi:uncharacterized cofD-like protein|nr:YvcK family protein [Candidatus Nomurabacteria bacterium]
MEISNLGARVVVIGGGTGSFTILTGLKNYVSDITALVSMADDGGSTGVLRDEYGVLPAGDIRQCLVALSHSPRVRDLFNYRFENGTLDGHSFGNLFLTALEKMTGNFSAGVELASEILQVTGKVEPITLDQVTLCMKDGARTVRHERNIDDKEFHDIKPELWLDPRPKANPAALRAIKNADLVVIAPGSLYTSLGAALVVPGIGQALATTRAKTVYICNLMNKPGQTDGFTVGDYADELERLAGAKFLDFVVYNNHQPHADLLKRYAADRELPVEYHAPIKRLHYQIKAADLLARNVWRGGNRSDRVRRTLIRHDPDRVARQTMKIFFS